MNILYGFSGPKEKILPSIFSLIDSHQDVHFDIYIASTTTNISNQNAEYIKNLSIPRVNFFIETFNTSNLPPCKNFVFEAYMRLEFPKYHPEIERYLYLDCDTLILQNIKDFYFANFSNNYMQAILDRNPHYEGFRNYINSGVILFNNRLILQDKMLDSIQFEYDKFRARNADPYMCDQTIINKVFEDRMLLAPRKYNDCDTNRYRETIIHHFYGSPKPNVFDRHPHDNQLFKLYQCYWDVVTKNQPNPWNETSPEKRFCSFTE